MFDNFPYTDMHQLNLDWIIKIAKDFLDQYTHIQQLIEDGEQSLTDLTTDGLAQLQEKEEAMESLLDQWYNTHSEDIAGQLAQALQDLNDWYTLHSGYLDQTLLDKEAAFDAHAEAKAADTIASIPDDYTAVSNDVSILKKGFVALIDTTPVDEAYIHKTTGVQTSNAASSCTDYIDVTPGYFILLKNLYLAGNRGVCFYDHEKNYLSSADIDSSHTSAVIQVPDCASYVRASGAQGTYPLVYYADNTMTDILANNTILEFLQDNDSFGKTITILNYNDWIVGGIKSDGTDNDAVSTRIRTDYIDITPYPAITIDVDSGYSYTYYLYNSEYTLLKAVTSFVETDTVIAYPKNYKYIRISARKNDDSDADVTFSKKINLVVNNTVSILKTAVNNIDVIGVNTTFANNAGWVVGSIRTNGTDNDSAPTRIRSGYIDIHDFKLVQLTINADYSYTWFVYAADGTLVDSVSSFTSNPTKIITDAGYEYLRIVVRKNDNSNANVSFAEQLTITAMNPVTYLEYNINGTGNASYYGDPIVLSQALMQRRAGNMANWLEITADTGFDVSHYNYYRSQSMAIYNGYLFLFIHGAIGAVINYATKEFISTFTTSGSSGNHQNSAQFTDIFYDPDDEFPLVAVSQYSNDGYCYFYRIQRSGTTFTFTLVNTIKQGFTCYGNSWGIDNDNDTITMIAYVNGPYSQATDNPTYFYTWKMPSKADILSGAPIVLDADDAISTSHLDYSIIQAIYCKNGLAYTTLQYNNVYGVYVVDPTAGKIVSYIPATDASELEGLAIYDSAILTFHRRGSDTTEPNPVTFYKFTC